MANRSVTASRGSSNYRRWFLVLIQGLQIQNYVEQVKSLEGVDGAESSQLVNLG